MDSNKILVLSLSKISPTSSRELKEGKTLLKNGFEIIIASLCYENQTEIDKIEGISIRRFVLKTKKLSKKIIFQMVKWFEWYQLIKLWLKNEKWKPYIIDCHCLYTLLIGVILAKRFRCKVIFNAHELETERAGLSGLRKRISKILEFNLIKSCSATIVVSQSILEWYQQAYPNINVYCIFNAPMLQNPVQNNYFRTNYNLDDNDIVFLYQGGLSAGRGVPLLLETFQQLPPKFHIVFMGDGLLFKEIEEKSQMFSNIHVHEAVPQKDLPQYTSTADYGVSLIESVSLSYEYCMPNKLFEYTMYEVPVIVSATKDQVSFVKTNEIGYVLEDYSPNGLKELILSLDITARDSLVQNIKKIRTDISWENQEKKLIDIYCNVLENK